HRNVAVRCGIHKGNAHMAVYADRIHFSALFFGKEPELAFEIGVLNHHGAAGYGAIGTYRREHGGLDSSDQFRQALNLLVRCHLKPPCRPFVAAKNPPEMRADRGCMNIITWRSAPYCAAFIGTIGSRRGTISYRVG